MNYIGSKLSLLEFLDESINKVVTDDCRIFCDLFAGTGAVGIYFKKKGYQVIANDIQYYSYILNRHYVGNHKSLKFSGLLEIIPDLRTVGVADRPEKVCNFLSDIRGVEGFIYKNYCVGGTRKSTHVRQYFSDENGKKCDAIRQQIEEWKNAKKIIDDEYYFLLASLLESADKRANTASVYGAFLKKLKKTAQKPLTLTPATLIVNDRDHIVLNEEVNSVAEGIKGDILYLDPPYNQRQYATNYHLLETLAKYDNPKIHGKTGLRDYGDQKSLYCSRRDVKEAFKELILKAKAKYIFLSYNNEGLMTPNDVKEIMSMRGKYGVFTKNYGRFKADKTSAKRKYKANNTIEYLHFVVCK